jgi:hypothetical protein
MNGGTVNVRSDGAYDGLMDQHIDRVLIFLAGALK